MTLYLIRHAHAGTAQPDRPDDHLRPLSRKGQKQTRALERALTALELHFDRLFSSPYTRAAETAAPLRARTRGGRLELLTELAGDDYPGLLGALLTNLKKSDRAVALVGHEPYLGDLTRYLLGGSKEHVAEHVTVRFRKSMIVELGGPLEAGCFELCSALSPDVIKRLTKRS